MPFSRYLIRNEYSLADPELYKTADKDDPEALLEGVAMAGLVGVLRQLGDLAEFAAEIFHNLHEEVMVTATRGHGLLVRVQQLESEFPSIERAFLSQTGHSAFFSSSGISWHPNLQTEQNLITRGDLPRFVMDSYEECRGPPRLFLLDKFDVAGAGACLKRYTDPSFYKVEASSYEMTNAETQRDKKTRKTKKRGPRWKKGGTPEILQPSHVKLHQLLLEERIQNGVSEPARHVKLKKRQNKFPFDMEDGKGYMEKLLSSPSEDKLVHEVPFGSHESRLEISKVSMINSPLVLPEQNRNPYVSPSVDKTVPMEHTDNMPENVPGRLVQELSSSSLGLETEVEEKHISVDGEHRKDGYGSDDVASETDNYVDALTTMESENETDAELKVNPDDPSIKQETYSDSNIEQLQSQSSDSQSASDGGSSSIMKKITSFSYSDTTSMSADSTAFACTEIPFHPRVSPNEALPVDQGTTSKERTSRESDLNEMSLENSLDLNRLTIRDENQINPESIIASNATCGVGESPSSNVNEAEYTEDNYIRAAEDDVLLGISDLVSHSSDDETELKERETKVVTAALSDPVDVYRNGYNGLFTLGDEKELEKSEPKSVNLEIKAVTAAVSVLYDVDIIESKGLSTSENDKELEEKEVESIDLETEAAICVVAVPADMGNNECNSLSSPEEPGEKDLNEQSVISPEYCDTASYDHSNIQLLICGDVIENDVDNPSANLKILQDQSQFVSEETDQNGLQTDVESQPVDIIPSDQSKGHVKDTSDQDLEVRSPNKGDHIDKPEAQSSIPGHSLLIEEKVDQLHSETYPVNHETRHLERNEEFQDDVESTTLQRSVHIIEKADQNVLQTDVDSQPGNITHSDQSHVQFLDSAPDSPVSTEAQTGLHLDDVTAVPSKYVHDLEAKVDHERVDSQNLVAHETCVDTHSEPYPVNHESHYLEQGEEFQGESTLQHFLPVSEEPSMVDLPQSSSHINLSDEVEYPLVPVFSGFGMLPELAPINLEEAPPLPPLPPMQWRMGKLQNAPLPSRSETGQHSIGYFPSIFPQMASHPSLDLKENTANQKSEHDYENTEISVSTDSSLHKEKDNNLVISSEVNAVKFSEHILPQPPFEREESQHVSTSGREIIWPSSTSSLPPVDDERPNGIRPMKIQRPRTPLIDAVAAHDKSKLRKVPERARPEIPKEEERDTLLQLRKVSERARPEIPKEEERDTLLQLRKVPERARPEIPKEEERDTLLEQIRAKSFNLKPAVQTRPSIQGPATNLRVAAILEKANAIRQAFAGSDDDDSWSDS